MESGRMGGKEEWESGKIRQGALVCKPDTLAVTINKLTERLRERKRFERGREEIREKTQRDKEQWRERGVEKSRAPLLGGVRFHLCTTPGCYRASVYGLFIPLPPITTQWTALFSSAQCNNSWAILVWYTTGGTPNVSKKTSKDKKAEGEEAKIQFGLEVQYGANYAKGVVSLSLTMGSHAPQTCQPHVMSELWAFKSHVRSLGELYSLLFYL